MSEKTPSEQVELFLRREMPQIEMHGGVSQVEQADPEEGIVQIRLGGACSGCGISPMTVQAIKQRLPQEVDWVKEVIVSAQGGGSSRGPSINPDVIDDDVDAPF